MAEEAGYVIEMKIEVSGAAGLGEHQGAALRCEQSLAKLAFELTELGADGLYRQPESFCGTRDAAFLGDCPEIQHVSIVR